MPIYMDRHDLPDITAEDVAEAHKQDLEIQDQFNCRAITYWFDEERSTAFCLIEAPDKESVEKMHNHSHGLIPGNIIEVESNLVESFLGRIENPDRTEEGDGELIEIKESALRTILVIDIQKEAILKYKLGMNGYYNLIRKYKIFLEEAAKQFDGKLIENKEGFWIISFSSARKAVQCSLEISDLKESPEEIDQIRWSMGLNAGNPVTKKGNFFEEVIQVARRLCQSVHNSPVVATSLVSELYKKERLTELSSHKKIQTLRPNEERFLNNLMEVMDEVWNQTELTNSHLTKKLGISESQFYRKLSSLTGRTPSGFINEIRLNRAAQLIEDNEGNISRVAFETGFNNPSYFSKCFRDHFGFLPSAYRKVIQ